jgi:hypothetical protein
MVHLPILRQGRPYRSLDTLEVPHHRTGEPVAAISQANTGLIRRDLGQQSTARAALARWPVDRLIDLSRRAGEAFAGATLPLVRSMAPHGRPRTTWRRCLPRRLPFMLVRRNLLKIRVLSHIDEVLAGLTRGLDLA